MRVVSPSVGNLACLIDKGMARKIISKMNNGKVVELSMVVSDMVKTTGEAEVDIYCGLTGNLPMLSIYTIFVLMSFLECLRIGADHSQDFQFDERN